MKNQEYLPKLNQTTLVPIKKNINSNQNKFDDTRIPSPIKNRLEEKPKNTKKIETVKSFERLDIRNINNEDENEEINEEYDESTICSNPKKISLIDKLQQLAYMTKPKIEVNNKSDENIKSTDQLKAKISINEYIKEVRINPLLKNDFR